MSARHYPWARFRTITAAAVTAPLLALATWSAAAASAQPTGHAATAAPTAVSGWASPVYLMPLDNNPPSPATIKKIMVKTGEEHFLLAFVLDSGGCTPAWDGSASETVASDTQVAALIAAIRAAGGDAGVSFGGYNGTELGESCGSASQLASAYQSVIAKYHLTHVDFDIENTALGDSANEAKRAQAITTLEGEDPGLTVSLTVPMTSIGFPVTGTGEVQAAIAANARLDVVNILDFDYGLTSGASQAASDETVATDAVTQLESLYGWPAATAWSHLGITLMNGHTDQPSELFTTSTFTSLRKFAQTNQAARLSFWSLNRDLPCPAGVQEPWAPGTCSNIKQGRYAFTKIVARYAG